MEELTFRSVSPTSARDGVQKPGPVAGRPDTGAPTGLEKTSPPAPAPPSPAPESVKVESSSFDPEALEAAIADLNEKFSGTRGIRFKISPDTQELVVQVVDTESDEVIRSIPPEKLTEYFEGSSEPSGILLDDLA